MRILVPEISLRALLHGLLLLAVIGLGFRLGLSQNGMATITLYMSDKLVHLCGFALFTMIFGSFFGCYRMAMIVAIVAGASLEVMQIFIPNWEFSWMDMGANGLGAMLIWSLHLVRVALIEATSRRRIVHTIASRRLWTTPASGT